MRYLIIGNGAAGLTAALTLRALRPTDEVAIVSEEPHLTYSRCLLADYMAGEVTREQLTLHPAPFYRRQRLELLLGRRVERLDTVARQVLLGGGERVGYDRLLIATGAVASPAPLVDCSSERVLGLRTLDDAERIAALAASSSRAVVVGGGYIGLEAAHALRARGLGVTVLEMLPHVLYTSFDETAAGIIAGDLAASGIEILTGVDGAVDHLEAGAAGVRVALRSGEALEADLVVWATGVRSDLRLVRESAVRAEMGIPVDEYLQTTVPGVYAAGDVAQTRDLLTGRPQTTPIWPNAVAQGELAALNMAGERRAYTGEVGLQNAVEFRQVPAIAFGLSKATEADGYRVLARYQPRASVYRKVVLERGVVRGMTFVGDLRGAGIVNALIKAGTPVGAPRAERMLEGTFSLADLLPDAQDLTVASSRAQGYRIPAAAGA